jgi:hypothetical protein
LCLEKFFFKQQQRLSCNFSSGSRPNAFGAWHPFRQF